jgi:hypothetical protein
VDAVVRRALTGHVTERMQRHYSHTRKGWRGALTTIAVAAKNVMSSVPDYLLVETAFTAVQWAIVGPLMAFVHSKVASGARVERDRPFGPRAHTG